MFGSAARTPPEPAPGNIAVELIGGPHCGTVMHPSLSTAVIWMDSVDRNVSRADTPVPGIDPYYQAVYEVTAQRCHLHERVIGRYQKPTLKADS